MKKVALHNLGCKVNAYETEVMQQMLEKDGYSVVPFAEKADVYIINTCTVTNMADRKSRQMLHRARKQNPDAVVIAAGCYVQAAKEELLSDKGVDIVIGNNRKKDLVNILHRYFEKREKTEAVINLDHTDEYEALFLEKTGTHTRAIIKVQDGCNQFCSYCIIPFTRGRVRSRSLSDVKKEVEILSQRGYKEVVLTGIHLSSYGIDFEEDGSLLSLITMVQSIDGIERIRLGSLEPRIITEDFIKQLSGMNKFCPHFHLSLQSGCDDTLKRMNRRYTTQEYGQKCNIIRNYFSHPAITTDIIVGFPGETEEEFSQTKNFLTQLQLYETHIFKYSKRNGTKAAAMSNQVPDKEKTKRSNIMLKMGQENAGAFRRYYIGKKVGVLFEEKIEYKGQEYWSGFTKEYVKVLWKTDENPENHILKMKIADILENEYLIGSRNIT